MAVLKRYAEFRIEMKVIATEFSLKKNAKKNTKITTKDSKNLLKNIKFIGNI